MFMDTLLFVFMHYGWTFFLNCCLWCFMISLCFWYVKFCLPIGCYILILCMWQGTTLNDKIFFNIYLER
ncbi:hypothetical protein BC941DRAFT_422413 [Chlamydoabsidia padenii]|nr:hypothetical protein BC941DRAFT_422413 [Chlamydoabsidia padenii]